MRLLRKIFALIVSCIAGITGQAQTADNTLLFSFGVIADVQYADADQWGKRDYRGSPKRLEKCVEIFNAHQLSFIVHAGDLIDRDYQSFELPLGIFGKSRARVHYVVGNHEFSVADSLKRKVRSLISNPRGYYVFVVENIQFILLDAMDVSPHSSVRDSKDHARASAMLKELELRKANNAYEWNGAMGEQQLKWLKKRLRQGQRLGYKTILFSHLPLLPENGLHLWNSRSVLSLLDAYSSVIAFISGHHHDGGYIKEGRVHHLTLKGLVESTSDSACGIVEVYEDKLVIEGYGDQPDYTLEY